MLKYHIVSCIVYYRNFETDCESMMMMMMMTFFGPSPPTPPMAQDESTLMMMSVVVMMVVVERLSNELLLDGFVNNLRNAY